MTAEEQLRALYDGLPLAAAQPRYRLVDIMLTLTGPQPPYQWRKVAADVEWEERFHRRWEPELARQCGELAKRLRRLAVSPQPVPRR